MFPIRDLSDAERNRQFLREMRNSHPILWTQSSEASEDRNSEGQSSKHDVASPARESVLDDSNDSAMDDDGSDSSFEI